MSFIEIWHRTGFVYGENLLATKKEKLAFQHYFEREVQSSSAFKQRTYLLFLYSLRLLTGLQRICQNSIESTTMNVDFIFVLFSCGVRGSGHLNKRFVHYPELCGVQWEYDNAPAVIQ